MIWEIAFSLFTQCAHAGGLSELQYMSNARYESLDTIVGLLVIRFPSEYHFAHCRLLHGRPKDAPLEIQSVRNCVTPRPRAPV